MKQPSIHPSRSVFTGLLLLAGAASACMGEDAEGWDTEGSNEEAALELGAVEQPFSDSATTSSVTSNENNSAPFKNTVKFNLGSSCSGIQIQKATGSTRARILTAGHCIGESASNRTVAITNSIAGSSPVNFTIPGGRTFVHPSFQLGNVGGGFISDNVYDVAFFELETDPGFGESLLGINFIQNNGVSLTAVGYGEAGVNCGGSGGSKKKAGVLSTFVVGDDRDAHKVFTDGDPTPCDGDSGGPLLLGTGSAAKVVGVVSGHSGQGSDALSSYTRIQGAFEWLFDPVDSTLATIPSSLIKNNSSLYLMNGALKLTRPLLGCAVMIGTGSASGTDVRVQTCDVLDGTTDGNSPAWTLVTSPAGGNSFKLLNRRNGLCLGVNVAPVSLTNVAAFTCATAAGAALDRQSWTFEQVSGVSSSKAFRLKTRASSTLCLSSIGNDNDDVVLATCGASALDVHKWYLTR